MAESLIKWRKEDYLNLGRAVSRFNKRIKELEVNDIDYLPDLKDYKELKENILSRKELNRILNSLRKFNVEGMNEKVELPSGQILTKWEYSEIKLARNRALKSLQAEKISIEQGKKWLGMGDERIDQIESTIEDMELLENLNVKSEFTRLKQRISFLGKKDIELVRAEQYRTNFMQSLEEMSAYDNYEKLYNKLVNIRNPITFYNTVRKSETLLDLFLYYKDKAEAQTYGGFASNQEAFNKGLRDLGIKIKE